MYSINNNRDQHGIQNFLLDRERQKRHLEQTTQTQTQTSPGTTSTSLISPEIPKSQKDADRELLLSLIRRYKEFHQKRISSMDHYIRFSNRKKTPIQIPQNFEDWLRTREPVLDGHRLNPNYPVIAPMNADGRNIESVQAYSDTEDGKLFYKFINQPTIRNAQNAFGGTHKSIGLLRSFFPDISPTSTPPVKESYAVTPSGASTVSKSPSSSLINCHGTETFVSTTWRQDVDHANKNLILPPQNQYLCGCCWAVSTATSAADAFAIAGLLTKQTLLSWTDMLACYPTCKTASCGAVIKDGISYSPSYQCGGGNFVSAAQWAVHKGLVTSHCLCFDWCVGNEGCTGKGKASLNSKELNALIPKNCSSCSTACSPSTAMSTTIPIIPSTKPPVSSPGTKIVLSSSSPSPGGQTPRFYLKSATAEVLTPGQANNATAIQNHISTVQNWLKNKGTVTATVIIYQNFMLYPASAPTTSSNGVVSPTKSASSFISPPVPPMTKSPNPGGVYLELVGSNSTRSSSVNNNEILGAHAVSVVGYSYDPVHWSLLYSSENDACQSGQTMDKEGYIMISSWIVRNSWGPLWSDKGFVKFATAPYNMNSCLDVAVQITTQNGSVTSGGMMLLEAGFADFYPTSTLQATDFTDASIVRVNKEIVSTALEVATKARAAALPAPTSAATETSTDPSTEFDDKNPLIQGGGDEEENYTLSNVPDLGMFFPSSQKEAYVNSYRFPQWTKILLLSLVVIVVVTIIIFLLSPSSPQGATTIIHPSHPSHLQHPSHLPHRLLIQYPYPSTHPTNTSNPPSSFYPTPHSSISI
jgi:hypothetical protein